MPIFLGYEKRAAPQKLETLFFDTEMFEDVSLKGGLNELSLSNGDQHQKR